MTVAKTYAPTRTVGNGVTSAFTANFRVTDTSDPLVTLMDTGAITNPAVQVLDTDYSVTINESSETATITFLLTDPPATKDVLIESVLAYTQPADLPDVANIQESVLETAYDRNTRLIQQLSEKIGRQISMSVEDSTNKPSFDFELPTALTSNGIIQINNTGLGFAVGSLASAGAISVPTTSGIEVYLGGNTTVSRSLSALGDIQISDPSGLSGNPTIDSRNVTSQVKVDFAAATSGLGASLVGVFDTAGKTSATDQETLNVELLANTLRHAAGSFTSDGTNDRTITTSIPSGATIISAKVTQAGINYTTFYHIGDSANNVAHGASGHTGFANADTRFILSGVDFIVGASGTNAGAAAVGWTITYIL